jgi:hypothetical protein
VTIDKNSRACMTLSEGFCEAAVGTVSAAILATITSRNSK